MRSWSDPVAKADKAFMMQALDLARSAMERQFDLPVSALLVVGSKVKARACNTLISKDDRLGHAEIRAIHAAIVRRSKLTIEEREASTLYTTLEPCEMCFGAIMNYNIGRVCYALESLGDGIVYHRKEQGRHQPRLRPPIRTFPVLRDESASLFREFAARKKGPKWAIEWASNLTDQVLAKPTKKATFRILSHGQCATDLLYKLSSEATLGDPSDLFCSACKAADHHMIEVAAIGDIFSVVDLSRKLGL